MLRFNKEQRDAWNALFRTEQGKVCLSYLQDYLLKVRFGHNASVDGVSAAMYLSAVAGELEFIQHLIETSKEEKNDGRSKRVI